MAAGVKHSMVLGVLVLAGCDLQIFKEREQEMSCFTVIPANNDQPQAPILLNECTGQTWLLVKSAMTDQPNSEYTFQWMKLDRLDYVTPTLVRK